MISGEIKAGDVLYDVRNKRAGNTAMRRLSWWPVHVYAVDGLRAWISWNGNTVRWVTMTALRKYRRSIPKKLAGTRGIKPYGSTFAVPEGWRPPEYDK